MRFHSTRGGADVSLETALVNGLAPDGGLYVPSSVPAVPGDWRQYDTLAALGCAILRPFLEGEITTQHIHRLVHDALNFPVPVVRLEGSEEMYIAELFHGPTLSFKDFGARTMARCLQHFVQGEALTILVATSGDTGSAVADGFAGQTGLRVALLFPEGQVSPIQRAQLTCRRPGVRAYAVEGTFDACQAMVKGVLQAPEGLRLSSANSINVGRLLPQMLYYFWAVRESGKERPIICVPSGNLGNLTAGMLAMLAGLPVKGFLAAHNANDPFPNFLATGETSFGDSVRTVSNAMDVGRPSNFERLVHLVPDMRDWITGYSVTDDQTLHMMREVYQSTGYAADPHTAVGLEAVKQHRKVHGGGDAYIVMATAHPAKFPETAERAYGVQPTVPPALARIADEPQRVRPLRATDEALRDALHAWS